MNKNIEAYDNTFIANFQVTAQQLPELTYGSVPGWDSVGHMGFISSLEEAFDIMMETDDIIDFSSYTKGKEILKKYNINV